MEISEGVEFDTPFEKGRIALTSPDRDGNFEARDSEGVECTFSLSLVTYIPPC